VRHCAYLYDWLDISDRAGEAAAFSVRLPPPSRLMPLSGRHTELIHTAMAIDAVGSILLGNI